MDKYQRSHLGVTVEREADTPPWKPTWLAGKSTIFEDVLPVSFHWSFNVLLVFSGCRYLQHINHNYTCTFHSCISSVYIFIFLLIITSLNSPKHFDKHCALTCLDDDFHHPTTTVAGSHPAIFEAFASRGHQDSLRATSAIGWIKW